HRDELAALELAGDLPGGSPCDAQALRRPTEQQFAVVAIEAAADPNVDGLPVLLEEPSAQLSALEIESKTVMPMQILERSRPARAHRALGNLQVGKDAAAVIQEHGAIVGKRKTARRAQQQPRAEPLLQRIDAATENHGSDAFLQRGGREAPLVDDLHKRGNFLESIHYISEVSNQSTRIDVIR